MRASFGVQLPQGWRSDLSHLPASAQYEMISKVALTAENLKFDSIFLYDHLHAVPVPQRQPCFECWTTMAALASKTTNIRIGSLVTCNSYRNPALLAKMSSTLDNISNGRLDFGIGAGWLKEEHTAYGYDFPSAAERIRRLDESLTLIKKMWTSEKTDFSGKYYTCRNASCYPKPIHQPHPPILVGGIGERLLLRVVAKHADIWNFQGSLEELKQKLVVLREHCDRVGRRFNEIRVSLHATVVIGSDESDVKERFGRFLSRERGEQGTLHYYVSEAIRDPSRTVKTIFKRAQGKLGKTVIVGTPSECLEQLKAYSELGVSHFVVYVSDSSELSSLKLFANEVVKDFA